LISQFATYKVITSLCLEGNENRSKFCGQNVKPQLIGNTFKGHTDTQQDKRAVDFHKIADQS